MSSKGIGGGEGWAIVMEITTGGSFLRALMHRMAPIQAISRSTQTFEFIVELFKRCPEEMNCEEEEEKFLLGKQSAGNKSKIQPDSPKDLLLQAGGVVGGSGLSMGTQLSSTVCQLKIDERLLIDARLLFVGSKIGEGAHGKVYEGKSKIWFPEWQLRTGSDWCLLGNLRSGSLSSGPKFACAVEKRKGLEKWPHENRHQESHISKLYHVRHFNHYPHDFLNMDEPCILDLDSPLDVQLSNKLERIIILHPVSKLIGTGNKTFLGYQDQTLAIKILQPGETQEERLKLEARFAREVAMMSRVHHKNLIKFIGACKDPFMVIATELLPGMSLRKYMMNLRPNILELHVAISFALDIAQAMDCLHANGIIHRDLKPDNLLLTADQKSVKLIDFGLAREESLTEMMTAETGTYRWMAPELYSTVTLRHGDKKHYNNKVDVYSFSIVLWELLTNRMPFEGMSNLQAAYASAFKQVRPSLPDDLPNDLVFILQSCWAEDPNIRPNFTQIVRMLNTFLYTLPGCPQHPLLTSKGSNSLKESPGSRLVRDNASEDGSLGAVARAKGRFSFFRRCFASGRTKDLA
eukprot:Gb_06689 [translate_table: standard]